MKVKKIIKTKSRPIKKFTQENLQSLSFKSNPLNSKKKKKIHKEMDRVLKKIEESKALDGQKPRKKLKERIQMVSGGLPGLGKRH